MKMLLQTGALSLALLVQGVFSAPTSTPEGFKRDADGKIRVKYGPYTVPAAGTGFMSGVAMPTSMNVAMPCTDCLYTYLKGDLIDKDGKVILREDGIYLHHMTLISPMRMVSEDWVSAFSGNDFSFSSISKPLYLIGEETFAINYPNAGVFVHPNQTATLSSMIQNREAKARDVWIQMTYDFIPGKPAGYVDVIPVSQDALGLAALVQTSNKFSRVSNTYTSPFDGRILMMYGHLHDGGIHTELKLNDKVVCDSIAYYGDMKAPSAGGLEVGHSHGRRDISRRDNPMAPKTKSHIKSFGTCNEVAKIKKGDKITTEVFYDFESRPRDMNKDGTPGDLMGISMTYLGIPLPKQ